jgi:enamine deaminase RidA (YjgF/YER057c/UK114 family)
MSTCANVCVKSTRSYGSLWLHAVPKAGWTEYLLGARPATTASPARWAADLANFVLETGATLVELDGFGDEALIRELRQALAKVLPAGFPASFMLNSGNHAPLGGGLLVRAVLGVAVSPVRAGECTIGYQFEDDHAAYCYLGGLVPATPGLDGAGQTTEVMTAIKSGLETAGMTFRDVVRTWYYLDGILSWYDDFNRARTAFFNEHDVFSRLMPASTGIGIANSSGQLVLAKVHACRAKSAAFQVRVADSPLQGSAYAYGSAFSRAVEIATPAGRTLHISGTASIAPSGATEYLDDVPAQIRRTLEVVEAILEHAGMSWADTVRGIAYFNTAPELALWAANRANLALPAQVELVVHADICRTDLLFELELEAVRA